MATGQARRDEIVAATVTVLRRVGFADVTVRMIAAEMGVSVGLLHHYFESIDHVLAAAFRSAALDDLQSMQKQLANRSTPIDQLAHLIDGFVPRGEDWTYVLWAEAEAMAFRRPPLRAAQRELFVAWEQTIEQVIRLGVDEGTFRCEDIRSSAWRLHGVMSGLATQLSLHSRLLRRVEIVDWVVRLAAHELDVDADQLLAALPRRSRMKST